MYAHVSEVANSCMHQYQPPCQPPYN